MDNKIKTILNKPYPNTKDINITSELSELILNSLGGKTSEMTATNQYIFQQIILHDKYKEIKSILKQIAIVEMKHYEILGELLSNNGFTPFLGNINTKNNFEVWNASYVYYNKNIKNFLKNNILSEETAIKNYMKIIELSKDEKLNNLIARIIEDEQNHINIFTQLLNLSI